MGYKEKVAMNYDMVSEDVVELCVILNDERTCKKLQTMMNMKLQLGNPEIYQFDYEPGKRNNYLYAYYTDKDVARRVYYHIARGDSFIGEGFFSAQLQKGYKIIRDKKDGKLYVDGFAHSRLDV